VFKGDCLRFQTLGDLFKNLCFDCVELELKYSHIVLDGCLRGHPRFFAGSFAATGEVGSISLSGLVSIGTIGVVSRSVLTAVLESSSKMEGMVRGIKD